MDFTSYMEWRKVFWLRYLRISAFCFVKLNLIAVDKIKTVCNFFLKTNKCDKWVGNLTPQCSLL
jgi:hypothetical protein